MELAFVLFNKVIAGILIAAVLIVAWEHRISPRLRHIAAMAISHTLLLTIFGFGGAILPLWGTLLLYVAYGLTAFGFYEIYRVKIA